MNPKTQKQLIWFVLIGLKLNHHCWKGGTGTEVVVQARAGLVNYYFAIVFQLRLPQNTTSFLWLRLPSPTFTLWYDLGVELYENNVKESDSEVYVTQVRLDFTIFYFFIFKFILKKAYTKMLLYNNNRWRSTTINYDDKNNNHIIEWTAELRTTPIPIGIVGIIFGKMAMKLMKQ